MKERYFSTLILPISLLGVSKTFWPEFIPDMQHCYPDELMDFNQVI
jgi:hypothetical protein